ncbi:MAG: GntR family transcriptional regulator [Clostridium fessum]
MQGQRKASNTTTSEIVLESLREQIINGTLQPQEKLIEAEIAQKFGLSRGPVREALRQLAVEGLVDYCPNKGCTVALLSPQDAYEVFFYAAALKSWRFRKAIAVSVIMIS